MATDRAAKRHALCGALGHSAGHSSDPAQGEGSDTAVCGYVAKYSTKAAENAGGADRRLRSSYEIGQLAVTDHARAMMATCWALGGLAQYEHLRLRAWAHMLGFRGHFLTKARRYSVTFGALRTSRVRFKMKLAFIARALAGETVFDPDSTSSSGVSRSPAWALGSHRRSRLLVLPAGWRHERADHTTPALRSDRHCLAPRAGGDRRATGC